MGKIDGVRLRAYLHQLATQVENDGSVEIYSIPLEGRTLRVAILGPDTVAASNQPGPQVIRGIVARSRKLASPSGVPRSYGNITNGFHFPVCHSAAWSGPSSRSSPPDRATAPMSLSTLFTQPAVVVASARYYLGNIHFRGRRSRAVSMTPGMPVSNLVLFSVFFTRPRVRLGGRQRIRT